MTTYIDAMRSMTCGQVQAAIDGFSRRHAEHWEDWLRVGPSRRADTFGAILRGWQATRPRVMRRTRSDRRHEPPFLEDLLEEADGRVRRLRGLAVESVRNRTADQESALVGLWHIFKELAIPAPASSVGISKAILLATNGDFGPALDSQVQGRLGVPRPTTAREWVEVLEGVADDIAAFEAHSGALGGCVPNRYRHLAYGRLYDMALGPR